MSTLHETEPLLKSISVDRLYGEITSRRSNLSTMKAQLSSLEQKMKQMCHDLIFKGSIDVSEKEIEEIRLMAESLKKEIKILDNCSPLCGKVAKRIEKNIPSYRECVISFVDDTNETFTPVELAEHVAAKRMTEPSNSVRVYVHRIIKDLLLEGKISQVDHGHYKRNEGLYEQ
jgi:hypothetical protein